jgi:hypothetical protein
MPLTPFHAERIPLSWESSPIDPWEPLRADGFPNEEIDMLIESGLPPQLFLFQRYFSRYTDILTAKRTVEGSDYAIAPRYFSSIYYNDEGILTVLVLRGAFFDADSAAAINDIRARGIIVREAVHTQHDLLRVMRGIENEVFKHGATGLWVDTVSDRVVVELYPYTPQQREGLADVLRSAGFNLSMIHFRPTVTEAMREAQAAQYMRAAAGHVGAIAVPGETVVAKTEIEFTFYNHTEYDFFYNNPSNLAKYVNGQWLPVVRLPGRGGDLHLGFGSFIQAGGIIRNFRVNFDRNYGELLPGRYLFMYEGTRGRWLGGLGYQWVDIEPAFLMVEFEITADTPRELPPQVQATAIAPFVEYVSHTNVTSTGMSVTFKNMSPFGIDAYFAAEVIHVSDSEWIALHQWYSDFMPAGTQLTLDVCWEDAVGALLPGAYSLFIVLHGNVHPSNDWREMVLYFSVGFEVR